MINEKQAVKFCKEAINLIENYDKAMADTTQTWHCHHRDEVKVLPSGMKVVRKAEELKANGRYYGCPANELIFLTPSEHHFIHSYKNNWSQVSEETRKKISEGVKRNPVRYWKGKKKPAELVVKVAKARCGQVWSEFGRKFKEHYGETHATMPKLYHREMRFYRKHGKCSWEVEYV